jgi:hypothetical protein
MLVLDLTRVNLGEGEAGGGTLDFLSMVYIDICDHYHIVDCTAKAGG